MLFRSERGDFFEQTLKKVTNSTKLIILILDSSKSGESHKYWEFYCDNIIDLDYNTVQLDFTTLRDYYIRTIEIVKARFQSHIWGKHQLKIYKKLDIPNVERKELNSIMRRAHPYIIEGGVFIYPSIHYYLSRYKKRSSTGDVKLVPIVIEDLNKTLGGGLPEGRCTAFMGCRGGHKSHLGYLHILDRDRKSHV